MKTRFKTIGVILTMTLLSEMTHALPVTGENDAQKLTRQKDPSRDLSNPENKALYCVGYAHLDTQWRWDFVKTIDEYIKSTLDDNFARLEKYPDYVFSFTGSVRYEMMKEYYPERYEKLKKYIAENRWFVSGSSVDEGDVNVPSAESIIRQVLYGNLYFQREFGKQSADFMLPDCFGFPASMPSLWAHCGLIGFSTQKLTWGSAVGIPFPVGLWEGPDGNSVIAALDPGSYASSVDGLVGTNQHWIDRVNKNGQLYGLWADYHYYGVGDQGGAPREEDVQNYTESGTQADRQMDILLTSSEQLYQDITPELRNRLPRYKGDMLLTEHSAGTLTSQSYMKRWNRMGEQLADAAERAAVQSAWLGQSVYPQAKLERAWVRLLANQMHDILPGTSIPKAYNYSWNDDLIAHNQFADVMTHSVGRVSALLDTQVTGTPIVVFNPLAIERTDIVEASIDDTVSPAFRVLAPDGGEVPSQLLGRESGKSKLIFLATVPANGYVVYDVRPSKTPFADGKGPKITGNSLENESYRVTVNEAGDIESVFDLRTNREVLAKPASLVFTYERPRSYPAWNMDWNDRKNPPTGKVDGKPQMRIVENGPLRVALAITRKARNSEFTQVIRLTRDDPGQTVEIAAKIDWQSTECSLKASFPFTASNPQATYNWGMGTIERGNNEPVKYEVPSHEWSDLTDTGGEFGVTILEDSKFGSDKPADNEMRLTLLYTPGVRNSFFDQHSQDWGIHDIRYGLYSHEGDWRKAKSQWRGRRFNQPLRAFITNKHPGVMGKTFTFANCNSPQFDIVALKGAERQEGIVVRVQELWGENLADGQIVFPTNLESVVEVDGQERKLQTLQVKGHKLNFSLSPYGLRSFLIKLAEPQMESKKAYVSTPVVLPFDTDVASFDADRKDGAMDVDGLSYPAELLPERLTDDDVQFHLGSTKAGESQAVTCRGQKIKLPDAGGKQIHLLAAATDDVQATFIVGNTPETLDIQDWTGFIGQWYDRVWDQQFGEVDFNCNGRVVSILPAYVKTSPIAWFATHRHHRTAGNQAYRFSYIYHYVLPRNEADSVTLPYDERIRIFAITVGDEAEIKPGVPLGESFPDAKPIAVRHKYAEKAPPVFQDHEPIAKVESQRMPEKEQTDIEEPSQQDGVDAQNKAGFVFRTYTGDPELGIHSQSGAVGDQLVRLNDGEVAENSDDTGRSVWYDNEGRFTIDLQESRFLDRINTYSRHVSNRAPQYFSVWGSNDETMPDPGFKAGVPTDWQLIAIVDTRELGEGGTHATTIKMKDKPIGPYRHLLWICEDVGQGTFFNEIDIWFAVPKALTDDQ